MQNTTSEYFICIKNQEITTNGRHKQRTLENWQRTGPNKLRRFTRVYLTIHIFGQQEKNLKSYQNKENKAMRII